MSDNEEASQPATAAPASATGIAPRGGGGAASAKPASGPGPSGPAKRRVVDVDAGLDAATAGACDAALSAFRSGRIDRAAAIAELNKQIRKGGGRPDDINPYLDAICQHMYQSAVAHAVGKARVAAPGGVQSVAAVLGPQPAVAPRMQRTPSVASSDQSSLAAGDLDDRHPEHVSRKRPAYDPTAAPFRDSPLRAAASAISPHVARTLEVRANYCADLRAAKADILRDGLSPPLPEILWEDVLANRAVDFDKILSARYARVVSNRNSQQLGDMDAYITVGAAPASLKVVNRSQWLECWGTYADAVAYAYPHRTAELRTYQRLMDDLFNSIHSSHHDSVLRADITMRNKVASERTWSFFDEDKLSRVHLRDTHSWGSGTIGNRNDEPKFKKPKLSQPDSSGEFCNNWNDRVCKFDKCRHVHACRICHRKDHAARDHMDAVRKEAEAGTRARIARAAGGGEA
ncbi:hypothetical protein AURDEDRAFT_128824 [Auricularia subglabra TFB-10046 SS5]|nr:hypothetical protein AURDEDRAFT_128824 [Auricularia subglabra TFB-10046 SS5]